MDKKRSASFDLENIRRRIDLLALVESDLGPGRKAGRWVLFHCPFPGHTHGDQNPSLAVTPDNGRWYCFACGRSGDAIAWLQQRAGLTFQAACEQLQGGSSSALESRPVRLPEPRQPETAPVRIWQEAAAALIDHCEQELWTAPGQRALEWLQKERGLQTETIKRFRLGYNPEVQRPAASDWGNPADSRERLYIPRGIVIPCLAAGEIWYIKIRRPVGDPKYIQVRGGRPALFGADDLKGWDLVLLTEGEFDAILAWQEIGDACGVATLGSATQGLDLAAWGRYFFPMRAVLAAYDLDEAGRRGLAKLAGGTARIRSITVPRLRAGDKDLSDYHQAGGGLWELLEYNLARLGLLQTLEEWAAEVGGKISYG
jgi:DNA primase